MENNLRIFRNYYISLVNILRIFGKIIIYDFKGNV